MVIDLNSMRFVRVDEQRMTVTFDGGCIWSDLEVKLDRRGLATVGGVVNHTGVGGLILGGGHGYLTPTHGLSIDVLLSATVVLADGSVVKASEQENADLFWALRGAGAQFGVVTRFTSRVFRQGQVWSGTLMYEADKLAEIVACANEFHERDNQDGHAMTMGLGFAPDGKRVVIVTPFYRDDDEKAAKAFFERLLDAEPIMEHTWLMPMGRVNTLMNDSSIHGLRRLMGGGNVAMPIDASAFQDTANLFWTFFETSDRAAKGLKSGQSALAIEFFPTGKLQSVKLEETAYANRGAYYDAVTIFGWEGEALDEEVRMFNREFVRRVRDAHGYQGSTAGSTTASDGAGTEENKGDGKGPVARYINLETDPVRAEDAYGGNLARLRALKGRFDPRGIFHKWHGFEA